MSLLAPEQPLHATAVALDGQAVLLRGPPGAGKSDLALRLIDRGWSLIGDDYVHLRRHGALLVLDPPPAIAGLIEVRGVGLVRLPFRAGVPLALVAELVPDGIERLPTGAHAMLLERPVPLVRLNPFEASAPLKLETALTLHRTKL